MGLLMVTLTGENGSSRLDKFGKTLDKSGSPIVGKVPHEMAARKLTKRQFEAYGFILRYTGEHGYPPSNREVAVGLGITLRPAQKLINALYVKGAITKISREARGIVL